MSVSKQRKPWIKATLLSILAAVLYYSWPLGYFLNPAASGRGLASDLEAFSQPYSWVFIGLDVISGILVIWSAILVGKALAKRRDAKFNWILIGYAVFGFLTALDAVLPLSCVPSELVCRPLWQDPMTIVHGIASVGSIAGLSLSLALCLYMARPRKVHFSYGYVLLQVMVVIWVGFGALTLLFITDDRTSNTAQHFFITFCSLWIAALPYMLWRFRHPVPARERAYK